MTNQELENARINVPKSKAVKAARVLSNHNVSAIIILIVATFVVLLMNSLIPMLYFEFGYTKGKTKDAAPYTAYVIARQTDDKIRLTGASDAALRKIDKEYKAKTYDRYAKEFNSLLETYYNNKSIIFVPTDTTETITDPITNETHIIKTTTQVPTQRMSEQEALSLFITSLTPNYFKIDSNTQEPIKLDETEYTMQHRSDWDVQKNNLEVKYYTKFFFTDYSWYIDTTISVLSAFIVFYSLFNYLIQVVKTKHEKYKEKEKEMDDTIKNHINPATFETWIDQDFNYPRKVEQHVANVKYDLIKLNNHTRLKVKQRLATYLKEIEKTIDRNRNEPETAIMSRTAQDVLEKLQPLSRAEKRYLQKRSQLLDKLQSDFIKNYIKTSKIKHFKAITPMFVYSGTSKEGKTTDTFSLIDTDIQRISKDAALKTPTVIMNSFLFALLIAMGFYLEQGEPVTFVLLAVLARVIPLLIQALLAVNYTRKFTDDHLIPNLISRRTIALLYLAHEKEKQENRENQEKQ